METFASASAFPHAIFSWAPSSDEVSSREIVELSNFNFYVKLMKKLISFNNSRFMHHLETFTSASAFPHATLPSAPSSDEVSSREVDKYVNPPLLRETDKK